MVQFIMQNTDFKIISTSTINVWWDPFGRIIHQPFSGYRFSIQMHGLTWITACQILKRSFWHSYIWFICFSRYICNFSGVNRTETRLLYTGSRGQQSKFGANVLSSSISQAQPCSLCLCGKLRKITEVKDLKKTDAASYKKNISITNKTLS